MSGDESVNTVNLLYIGRTPSGNDTYFLTGHAKPVRFDANGIHYDAYKSLEINGSDATFGVGFEQMPSWQGTIVGKVIVPSDMYTTALEAGKANSRLHDRKLREKGETEEGLRKIIEDAKLKIQGVINAEVKMTTR